MSVKGLPELSSYSQYGGGLTMETPESSNSLNQLTSPLGVSGGVLESFQAFSYSQNQEFQENSKNTEYLTEEQVISRIQGLLLNLYEATSPNTKGRQFLDKFIAKMAGNSSSNSTVSSFTSESYSSPKNKITPKKSKQSGCSFVASPDYILEGLKEKGFV